MDGETLEKKQLKQNKVGVDVLSTQKKKSNSVQKGYGLQYY